nr:PREDICTED: uncharacterized protein LOC105662977 [Megachile rotundata]
MVAVPIVVVVKPLLLATLPCYNVLPRIDPVTYIKDVAESSLQKGRGTRNRKETGFYSQASTCRPSTSWSIHTLAIWFNDFPSYTKHSATNTVIQKDKLEEILFTYCRVLTQNRIIHIKGYRRVRKETKMQCKSFYFQKKLSFVSELTKKGKKKQEIMVRSHWMCTLGVARKEQRYNRHKKGAGE